MRRFKAAVILTHDRPKDFVDCLNAIGPQVDRVIVVSHRAQYAHQVYYLYSGQAGVIRYDVDVPNISTAWNLGLRDTRKIFKHHYDVAVLNDDAIVGPDWFDRITAEMRRVGAVAGSAARRGDPRMAGYAFILDGDAGLYADERFEWWYGDDDLERRASNLGGVVQVNGLHVEHRHPNSTTVGVLAEKAAQDAIRFKEKWA